MEKLKKRSILGICIKNYVSVLRYSFTALGIMFLMLLIGGSIFLNRSTKSVEKMVNRISTTTQNADLSLDGVGSALIDEFVTKTLNEFVEQSDANNDGFVSVSESKKAVENSFESVIQAKINNYTQYVENIEEIVMDTVTEISTIAMILIVVQIIGIVIAKGIIDFFAAMDIEHRNPIKVIFSRLAHSLITLLALFIVAFLLGAIPVVGGIFVLLSPIAYCIVSLVCSNLTLGKKHRLPFKQVLVPRNFLLLFVGDIIALACTAIIALFVLGISNFVISFYVAISLIIITTTSVSLNSDAIIHQLLTANEEAPAVDATVSEA